MITLNGLKKNEKITCIYGILDNVENKIVAIGQTTDYYNRMCKYRERIASGGNYEKGKSNKHIYKVVALEPERYSNVVLLELPKGINKQTLYNAERALQVAYDTFENGNGWDVFTKCPRCKKTEAEYSSNKEKIKRIIDRMVEYPDEYGDCKGAMMDYITHISQRDKDKEKVLEELA